MSPVIYTLLLDSKTSNKDLLHYIRDMIHTLNTRFNIYIQIILNSVVTPQYFNQLTTGLPPPVLTREGGVVSGVMRIKYFVNNLINNPPGQQQPEREIPIKDMMLNDMKNGGNEVDTHEDTKRETMRKYNTELNRRRGATPDLNEQYINKTLQETNPPPPPAIRRRQPQYGGNKQYISDVSEKQKNKADFDLSQIPDNIAHDEDVQAMFNHPDTDMLLSKIGDSV
jgi:hypothetical protein